MSSRYFIPFSHSAEDANAIMAIASPDATGPGIFYSALPALISRKAPLGDALPGRPRSRGRARRREQRVARVELGDVLPGRGREEREARVEFGDDATDAQVQGTDTACADASVGVLGAGTPVDEERELGAPERDDLVARALRRHVGVVVVAQDAAPHREKALDVG